MEILKNKIVFNESLVKRFIITNVGRELSALSTPCYYPKTKKVYFDLLSLLKISDKDVKEFIKRTYKGTKAENFKLVSDVTTNIFLVLMHLFLQKNDRSAFFSTLLYFMIINYSRLIHKQIQYCYEDSFKYTLDTITKTHLFAREKTISNSIYFLSLQVQKSFEGDLKSWDIDRVILFLSTSRSRISQSVKSFAEHYYRNKKEGAGIKTQIDYTDDEGNSNVYQYQVLKRGQKLVDDITKDITMYKSIDQKVFEEARALTKIKTSIATIIASNVSNEKHINNIRILLQLYIKEIPDVTSLCGKEFYSVVKRLMAVKRTIAQLYFKAQINILLIDILKDSQFLKVYQTYTPQTQFIINSFLAFYITLLVRRKACQI
jgi:hypothetical protein